MTGNATEAEAGGSGQFEKTHWTIVFQAARDPADTCAREALGWLYECYWKPLYYFVRRQGHTHPVAEDLTQAFFEHILEKHSLASVNPEKGTFRSWLLQSLKNFIANEWHKAKVKKRYPGSPILSINVDTAETEYELMPVDNASPDKIYEKECAWALVEQAILKLRAQYEAKGKIALYEELSPSLMGDRGDVHYPELAKRFATTPEALRTVASRMRKELRKFLKELLIPVSSNQADVESEFRTLLRALGQ